MRIYDYAAKDWNGQPIKLRQYEGKVLLIVNTASECGFTVQYKDLQAWYERYHDQGLEILAFPCNQFMGQEPGNNQEIQEFTRTKFGVTFPVMGKINVNGEDADPIFKYLKAQDAEENIDVPEDFQYYALMIEQAGGHHWGRELPWNFTKFLLNREGKVVGRYAPTADLGQVEKKIQELL